MTSLQQIHNYAVGNDDDDDAWFAPVQVDVENPDVVQFPDFLKASYQECVLEPGEVLFIPKQHWHYVRSLELSFSVSFWWS